jgi:predicted nucleic acid-binding protein
MIQVLLDRNIILDFALERLPYVENSEKLLRFAYQNKIIAYITASMVTDIYYIMRKQKSRDFAFNFLRNLLDIVDIAPVDKKVINGALNSPINDFEDAVQDHSAQN